ncbi:MAG: DUF2513 domain-containing protein [Cyanobacteria bacterium P01_E01_bin.45]
MDLVRDILIQIEATPPTKNRISLADEFDGFPKMAKISEHLYLLGEGQAGLIEIAEQTRRNGKIIYYAVRLTWAGHQFLADIKSEPRWKIVKKKVAEIGGASLPVWQQMAAQIGADLIQNVLK